MLMLTTTDTKNANFAICYTFSSDQGQLFEKDIFGWEKFPVLFKAVAFSVREILLLV